MAVATMQLVVLAVTRVVVPLMAVMLVPRGGDGGGDGVAVVVTMVVMVVDTAQLLTHRR